MKIPKALLGAIIVGIATQVTFSSCNKKEQDKIKPQNEQQAPSDSLPPNTDPCPACGMG